MAVGLFFRDTMMEILTTPQERLDHANQQIDLYSDLTRQVAHEVLSGTELVLHRLMNQEYDQFAEHSDVQRIAVRMDALCDHLLGLARWKSIFESEVNDERNRDASEDHHGSDCE